MKCAECGADTKVYDSRTLHDAVWRRRECAAGHRFTTMETRMDIDSYEYKAIREVAMENKRDEKKRNQHS